MNETTMKNIITTILLFCAFVALAQTVQIQPVSVKQTTGGQQTAANLTDGNLGTHWFVGWDRSAYPQTAVITLPDMANIDYIRFYDGTGMPVMSVTVDGIKLPDITLSQWKQWQTVWVKGRAKQVIVSLDSPLGDAMLSEVEFWGKIDGGAPVDPPQEPQEPTNPPTENKPDNGFQFGTNGFHWVPTKELAGFNHLREYIVWDWIEPTEKGYRFEPTAGASGNYDTHFQELKNAGITAIPCVNQSPSFIRDTYTPQDNDVRPCANGKDPLKPASYIEFARFWWQFTARYGSKKHDDSRLIVDNKPRWNGEPINVKKSGLGLVQYFEVWNEPDKWWKKPGPAYIEPEQYAALLSACYDGHENTMGDGIGIKNADPSAKVVMSGLTAFDTAYISRMYKWFSANRKDKRFAADVLNFHHYTNEDGGIFIGREYGVAPELDSIEKRISVLVSKCKSVAPNAQIWWSEFEYDTRPEGPHQSRATAKHSSEEVQGIWVVRSFLAAMSGGIDAAHIYNAINEPNPAGGLFQSSGFLTGQNETPKFSPKAGASIIRKFITELNGHKAVTSGKKNGVRYLITTDGKTVKLITWMPCAADCTGVISIMGKEIQATETPTITTLL